MNSKIIISIIVCIIILMAAYLLYALNSKKSAANNVLWDDKWRTGYWVGDPVFCESAGISDMLLFIGEDASIGYFVLGDVSQSITIKYGPQISPGVYNNCTIISDEPFEMPAVINMEFDMMRGMLRFYTDDVIYCVFNKDNEVTNLYFN